MEPMRAALARAKDVDAYVRPWYIQAMAISAISSISGSLPIQPARAGRILPLGAEPPIDRVRPIAALVRREGRQEEAKAEEAGDAAAADAGAAPGRPRPALDPRSPAIFFGKPSTPPSPEKLAQEKQLREREAGAKPKEDPQRDLRARLEELMGARSKVERRQAEAKNAQSAEVVSQLAQLRSRDSAVRAHEAAHIAAGGRYVTGGASYTYQRGPDGGEYAIGGEVGIDTSPVPGKPEETVQKMQTIRAAALAPSDPSAADISVAAGAAQVEAQALAQMAQARAEAAAGSYAQARGRGGQAGAAEAGPREAPINMVA